MARFNTCLGVSRLYLNEDDLAKDAFKKAVSLDSGSISAKVNLAALFNYYGHVEQAVQLYEGIPSPIDAEKARPHSPQGKGDLPCIRPDFKEVICVPWAY